MTLLLALACTPETPVKTDTAEAETPLHEVWGIAPAEDFDPDPGVVEVHLEAAKAEVQWVEEGPTEVWAYNGQVPGPLIHARVGDTLRVVFDNGLPSDDTTIHWHGLRIPDDQDGVPMIMDPVGPGESFTYEFTLPDAGTYWYHPHVAANEQVERGLQGAIVIDEPEPPAVDKDRYFVVDDVLLADDGRVEGHFANPDGMTVMMGRYGNTLLTNGSTELLVDTMRPGAVERWRFLNSANARPMKIDVQGADWRVVGTDGGLLEEPYTVGKQEIHPGQRFDVEVRAPEAGSVVELQMVIDGTRYPVFTATVEGEAIDEHDVSWPAAGLPEIMPAEQVIEVELGADTSGSELLWTVNGLAYEEGQMIDVIGDVPTTLHLTETSGLDHPFHLHGQFFQVVDREGEPADEPGLRDTVVVRGQGEVTVFTGFENAGRWMAHCHILEHAEAGMMTEYDVSEGGEGM